MIHQTSNYGNDCEDDGNDEDGNDDDDDDDDDDRDDDNNVDDDGGNQDMMTIGTCPHRPRRRLTRKILRKHRKDLLGSRQDEVSGRPFPLAF